MPRLYRFKVYQSRDGYWRWQLVAGNGEIVADSGGTCYTRQASAVRAAKNVKLQVSYAVIEVVK